MISYDLVVEPIDRWPDPDTLARKWAPFTGSHASTMDILRRELDMIGAKDRVVIQVVTRRGGTDLRRDGMLRADARIEHPGVRISIPTIKHGHLTYATDAFDGSYNRPGWQQNMRAIALGLEALRKVDRYGISKSGEQYRGWLQIEGAPPDLPAARQVLCRYAGQIVTDDHGMSTFTDAELFKWARRASHPDHHQGDRAAWDDVERLGKILGLL